MVTALLNGYTKLSMMCLGLKMARCIPRFIAWKSAAGFPPNGAFQKTTGEQNRVRANALLIPLAQRISDVQHTAAIVAGDDGGNTLHQIRLITFRLIVGEIAERVRVRIDEPGSNKQAAGINRAPSFEV